MQIKTEEENPFYIIKIFGDIDLTSSIILDKAIKEALEKDKKIILIDGQNINYIASAGLGVFASYLQDLKEKNIFFAVFGLKETVFDVFKIVGLHELMSIVNTKKEAQKLYDDSQI